MSQRNGTTYEYHDLQGNVVHRVYRGPGKKFRQEKGVDLSKVPIYRWPKVHDAVAEGRTVYIVEGEKDVHTLEGLGLTATTNAGGSNGWRSHHCIPFEGADVVIVPDLDPPGMKRARSIERDLAIFAEHVTMLYPAVGKDVTDHIEAGHTIDELLRTRPTESTENMVLLDEIEIDEVEQMEALIPLLAWRGYLSMLSARAKRGKSSLVAQGVARATSGREFLGEQSRPINVLYFSPDEAPQDTVLKLRKHGADGMRVWLRRPDSLAGLYDLITEVEDMGVDLIIIDSFLELVRIETGRVDENDAEVSNHLRKLAAKAHLGRYGVLVIAHGGHQADRPRGSSAILGVVDQIIVMKSPDEGFQTDPIRTLEYAGRRAMDDVEITFTELDGYRLAEDMSLADRVLVHVSLEPGISQTELRKRLSVGKNALKTVVDYLVYAMKIVRDEGLFIKGMEGG